mgnify:CR=1 FL=1
MRFLKHSNHKDVISNFFWRITQILGKQGVNFFIFILCARLLTTYEFGIYNYVLAITFFLILFGDFGISAAASKYVAEYNIKDKDKIKYILFNSAILLLALTIIISVLTLIFGQFYLKENYLYAVYLLPLIFIAPMTSLYDGIYRGLKKFKHLAIISTSTGIVFLFIVYILINKYGLIGALVSQNLFYLTMLIGLSLGYREFNFKFDSSIIKEIGKYSTIIGFGALGYFLYSRLGTIILGHFNYIEEISYFELINKIFITASIAFSVLGQVIAPDITKKAALNNYSSIKKSYLKYFILILSISLILAVFGYYALPVIVKYALPNYYTQEFFYMFNVLIFTFPLTMISQFMGQSFMIATGKAKYSLLTIPFGILNIILAYIFIISFGYIGVVYSILIVSTMNRLLTWALLYKEFSKNEKTS